MGLSIIMGNMFSGKTSELIRRLKRLKVIGKNILVVNSAKDTRSPDEVLKTHDNVKFNCLKVYDIFEVLKQVEFDEADVIAIDEAQFFPKLRRFVECCLLVNKSVILAGLDADSFQQKFGELIDCIPLACEVTKLSALCMHCNNGVSGPFTKRIVDDQRLELIGGSDMYEAVCRDHL
jgi:thymidine kinase|tara:strand:+ start:537 stop:1067 length:531 start_codon:yes stop_codon:yes gene_type:complete